MEHALTRESRQLFYNELTLYTRAFEPRAKQTSRVGSKIYVRIKKLGIENHRVCYYTIPVSRIRYILTRAFEP